MDKIIRLKNFDDFLEAASASEVILFQTSEVVRKTPEGKEQLFEHLLVYAVRYYWEGDFSGVEELNSTVDELRAIRAKEVVGSEYYDRLFR